MTEKQTIKDAADLVKHTAEITAQALVKFTADNAVLNTNIEYIKKDLSELRQEFKETKLKYIDYEQHKQVCDIQSDHEKRIRLLETNLTRVMTWGTAGILVLGLLEFLVSKYL